jgi:hypothetical protein
MTTPIVEQRDGVWVVTLPSSHGEVIGEGFPDEQAARNFAAWWQRTTEGLARMRARWEATT